MKVELLRSTGDERIDEILRDCIGALESALPGRVRGVSLIGSVANGTATSTSDIDGVVDFRGHLANAEAERFWQIVRACTQQAGIPLDFVPRDEETLMAEGELPAKRASRLLVYGEEIGRPVPAMSIAEYANRTMRGSFSPLGHVRGTPGRLRLPLEYPDPGGEFFGYERLGYRDLDGWRSPGTRALVNGLTLAATTIVGVRAGHGVVSRAESLEAYRDRIGDEWTALLYRAYDDCRTRWSYRIPEDPAERARLRSLCKQVLGFERHYLDVCRQHLIQQMSRDDETEQMLALETISRLTFPDDEVANAVRRLADSSNDRVRRLAGQIVAT